MRLGSARKKVLKSSRHSPHFSIFVLCANTSNGFLQRRSVPHASRAEAQLNQILHDVPSALAVLTETAEMALKAYGQHLSDGLALASKEAALLNGTDAYSPL